MAIEQLVYKLESMIGDDGIKVPGLGVIVYRGGKEIFSSFLGRRMLNPSKPMTRDTRFRVASLSKMFTVFSIMQLVEQKKIFLDEDASKYLGFELRNPTCPRKKITVRMLASHTSSLRDGKIYSTPPAVSVEEFFLPHGKFFEGGAHFGEGVGKFFTYSNLNYGLLGTIIERVTSQRFDIYQRENILSQLETKADYLPGNFSAEEFDLLGTIYRKKNPAGVWNEFGEWFGQVDDYKNVRPQKNIVALQNPYDENFQGVYNLEGYHVGTNATIFSPQGGLRISFEELSHALQMLMSGGIFRGKKILSRASVDEMIRPHWTFDGTNGDTCGGAILSYGLGIYFIDGKSSARVCKNHAVNLFGHTGQAFGMMSGLFFVPRTQSGFVYMMNGQAVQEDVDPRSFGQFSGNYIWEEKIMDAICKMI